MERRLQSTGLTEDEKKQERQALEQQERDYVRLQRQRMSSDDFEALKLIGRGAFGEVTYAHSEVFAHSAVYAWIMIDSQQGHLRQHLRESRVGCRCGYVER